MPKILPILNYVKLKYIAILIHLLNDPTYIMEPLGLNSTIPWKGTFI